MRALVRRMPDAPEFLPEERRMENVWEFNRYCVSPAGGGAGGMKKDNLCDYNKSLRPLANKLRKEMTRAEACLWKYVLRARQMQGYPFRRQRPVLTYIADFMCRELRLVIEVDGITHDFKSVQDKHRTDELTRAGYHVLRFTDEEVLTNIGGVAGEIERVIGEIRSRHERSDGKNHPLNPLPAGESKEVVRRGGIKCSKW